MAEWTRYSGDVEIVISLGSVGLKKRYTTTVAVAGKTISRVALQGPAGWARSGFEYDSNMAIDIIASSALEYAMANHGPILEYHVDRFRDGPGYMISREPDVRKSRRNPRRR